MRKAHSVRIEVKEKTEHNPKVDHNITLAGLLVTDADKAVGKLRRESKGILKGLYTFKKKIPTGEVYICNGAEFPTAEAVDLLLYLLIQSEKNAWNRKLTFKSLRELIKGVYNVDNIGKTWADQVKRGLIIWKNHSFYFSKSFLWEGHLIETYFGVIEDFTIKTQGRGKPAKVEIIFNEKFLEICRSTTWYRRPSWSEIRKLRKETAKRLYMVALEYKPSENSKDWKVFVDNDLKEWYRNTFNSLANPKHLRPSIVLNRIRRAIEEINKKTNLRMELQQTEEGNYCIKVKEIAPAGTEKIEIPFDKLSKEDKTLLLSYVEEVAKEKGIKSVWGFLRSLTSKQIETWLEEARKYFGVKTTEKKKETEEERELSENPELIEMLREWGKVRFSGKPALYEVYFGDGKLLKAYEQDKKIIFVCKDRILAKLMTQSLKKEIEELFNREVEFFGKEEFGSVM